MKDELSQKNHKVFVGLRPKDLVHEKEEFKCNNLIKQYKIINSDCVKEKHLKKIQVGHQLLIIYTEYW